MFPLEHGETVVRLRGHLVADPYSGEQTKRVWTNPEPDELEIVGVAIAPSTGTETQTVDRNTTTVPMSLYGAPDMDVQPQDRIRARTGMWEVEGEVATWDNPLTGWKPGVEFRVKKVKG